MNDTFLTIIICSRNRADEITGCLPGVIEQTRQFSDVEVLVVDNGSTDNTKEVVARFAADFPALRYVFEPTPGLCQARNRGRGEADGEILAYIDDDAVLKTNWIKNVRQHFIEKKSDCLAGKVTAELEGDAPFPIDDTMLWFFTATKFGEQGKFIKYPEHPVGCNMAFRAEVFDRAGGFDTNLKLYGDETDFFRRAGEKDFTTFYDPNVTVAQFIPNERLTIEELRHKSYIWGEGAATAWMLAAKPSGAARLLKSLEFSAKAVYVGTSARVKNNSFGKFYTLWYNRGFAAKLRKGL